MVPGKADPWELALRPGRRTLCRRAQPSLRGNKTQAGHRIFLSLFPRDQSLYSKTHRGQSLPRDETLPPLPQSSGAKPDVHREPREPSTKGRLQESDVPFVDELGELGQGPGPLHSALEHVTAVGEHVGQGWVSGPSRCPSQQRCHLEDPKQPLQDGCCDYAERLKEPRSRPRKGCGRQFPWPRAKHQPGR